MNYHRSIAALFAIITTPACDSEQLPLAETGLGAAVRSAAQRVRAHNQPPATPSADAAANRSASRDAGSQAAPPPGYVIMRAKAQLTPKQGNALVLVDEKDELLLPIFIGNTEALSIMLRLAQRRYTRPLTHDLFDTLMRKVGAELVQVQVDKIENKTFHGTIVLKLPTHEVIRIDARPSDAIALAIGNDAPIFVARKVLTKAGIRYDELESLAEQPDQQSTTL